MSVREYHLPVSQNDHKSGFYQTRHLLKRMMIGLIRLVGSVKFRLTIDLIMKRPIGEEEQREAGFRSTLRSLNSEAEIDSLISEIMNQIDNSIDKYCDAGMSGCTMWRTVGVRVMVVKPGV